MIKKFTRSRRSNDHINWAQATIFVGFVTAIVTLVVQIIDVTNGEKLGQMQNRITKLETRPCK